MSYTIIRPKDRNEWLEHRKSGIGSSEVATILGLNPWETPYQLWRRRGYQLRRSDARHMESPQAVNEV